MIRSACIIGIGAIGTIIASQLARNNVLCYLIEKNKEFLSKIRSRGLSYFDGKKTFHLKKNLIILEKIEDLPKEINVIFIATKCNAVEQIVNELSLNFKKDFTLILMTNGIIEEKIIHLHENFISCSVSFGATLVELGYSKKTSSGEILVGRWNSEKQEKDESIFRLIRLIDKSKWIKNIKGIKYAKLLINCATASFGLISGLTLGEILERRYMRMAFLILITEGVRICQALNIKLEKINKFDFQTLALLPNNPFSLEKKDEILKFIGNQYRELRSSSLASWERGEKTEIPFLNGYFVEKGHQLNIPVPLNALILETCMAIENGKKKPSINEMLLFETKVKEILENYL